MKNPEANHYFLISGIILFRTTQPGQDPVIGSAPGNAVVRHDSQNFGARKLAKAQQNLHHVFIAKLPEDMAGLCDVFDIIITNICFLGEMSEEEFQMTDPDPAAAAVAAAFPVEEQV